MTVMTYAASWPHERRCWVRYASHVEYSMELMDYGTFSFDVPANDPILAPDLAGTLIGITSERGLPDFCGAVERIDASETDGYVTLSGREWASVLQERSTQQSKVFRSGGGGDIGRDIARDAAARNPTGIELYRTGMTLPISSDFTVNSDQALEAMKSVAEQTGTEWEIRYHARHHARAQLFWRDVIGQDLSGVVHLAGPAIFDADYLFEAVNDTAVINVIASFGSAADRPSALVTDLPVVGDTASVRLRSGRKQNRGIFTSRELVISDASLPDGLAAQHRAIAALRNISAGREALSVTVTPAIDWSALRPGNTVTVRLRAVRLGGPVVLALRVLGVQTNDREVCEVVGTVKRAA